MTTRTQSFVHSAERGSDIKMHVVLIFVSHARPSYEKISIFSKEGLACETMLCYADKEDEAIFSRIDGQSGLC